MCETLIASPSCADLIPSPGCRSEPTSRGAQSLATSDSTHPRHNLEIADALLAMEKPMMISLGSGLRVPAGLLYPGPNARLPLLLVVSTRGV